MAVKKLIEVALPLDAINAASARDKSIRHGHPSTLHLWWARRPLSAARAIIWASLVDDPSSHTELFPTEEEQNQERDRLFKILEQLVVWENSNDERVLAAAKAEIRNSMGDEQVSFLDPFAGGGALPLEAYRLGLNTYAQDLNPVPIILNKSMLEVAPLFYGRTAVNPKDRLSRSPISWSAYDGLSCDVQYYGELLRDHARNNIGHLYPNITISSGSFKGEATPIAWLWARTVKCPNPACGCELPLMNSEAISNRQEILVKPSYENGQLAFHLDGGKPRKNSGTVNRRGATCPRCGTPVGFPYIREEGKAGRIGDKLMCVAAEGRRGRVYGEANDLHIRAADVERPDIYLGEFAHYPGYINPPAYGYTSIDSIFTDRQLYMLDTLTKLIPTVAKEAEEDAIKAGWEKGGKLVDGGSGAVAYGEAISIFLAFLIDKMADYHSSMCSWNAPGEKMRSTFGLNGMSMTWAYAEANPFSNSSGSINNMLKWVSEAVHELPYGISGHAEQFDAQSDNGLRNLVISTDPPYYSNVPFADFSDFFFVWLRRSLRSIYPELFGTMLTPKSEELVADPHREGRGIDGARNFFELGMFEALKKINLCSRDDVPVTIYYAFKQTETTTENEVESTASTGWETMLSAIVRSGFTITGTWPVRTERSGRTRSNGSNALASSIVLVCRKRPKDAPPATRRDFVNALKRELKPALDKLQTSNIAPVDLAQSAIGPGIGVYSRFSSVYEADGTEMTVRSALHIINQELDLYFSDQDSDLDRESRFCVDLYTQSAFNEIRFGEADVLARAKNTSIEGIATKGALRSAKGVVRLLGRDEIRDMPAPDFCWLFTQQLTHAMETGGIEACAKMLKDIYDGRADNARALAYRLFTIADKKGWNQEAFAYNSLVVAWRDIESRAAQLKQETPVQTALDI